MYKSIIMETNKSTKQVLKPNSDKSENILLTMPQNDDNVIPNSNFKCTNLISKIPFSKHPEQTAIAQDFNSTIANLKQKYEIKNRVKRFKESKTSFLNNFNENQNMIKNSLQENDSKIKDYPCSETSSEDTFEFEKDFHFTLPEFESFMSSFIQLNSVSRAIKLEECKIEKIYSFEIKNKELFLNRIRKRNTKNQESCKITIIETIKEFQKKPVKKGK